MHPNAMLPLDLEKITAAIASGTRPNQVLWQTEDSIAFVARGRAGRSEFHVDPSDEVMYMIKGDMNLHFRTPEGEEKVAVIREGGIIHCPAGTPHSPRFATDAFVLVIERKRRTGEQDRFFWYCPSCKAQLYEAVAARRRLSAKIRCPRSTPSSTAASRIARAASAGTSPHDWRRHPAPDQAGADSARLSSLAPDCLSNRWHFRKVSHTRSPARTL